MAFDFNSPPPRPSGGASPRGDLPRPPGSGPTPPGGASSGFRDVPQSRDTPQPPSVRPGPAGNGGRGGRGPRPPQPRTSRQPRGGGFAFPWAAVILLVLLAAVLGFCYLYRDAISNFLAQLLSWVIILLIIYLVLRGILFGGRRRR